MLSAVDKQRYARHLLLAEVGVAGQERLSSAPVQLPGGMEQGAAAVARDYLQRAGVHVTADARDAPGAFLPIADRAAVQALAGEVLLEPAAAALLGALHAVEQIKMRLQLGAPLQLPAGLCLSAAAFDVHGEAQS